MQARELKRMKIKEYMDSDSDDNEMMHEAKEEEEDKEIRKLLIFIITDRIFTPITQTE